MIRPQLIALAAFGSFALLGGAFVFQLLGYAPCKLCLWQRWPHGAAIVIGVVALLAVPYQKALAVLGACAALLTAGIGLYHTGVEQGWWEGPTSCTGGAALNIDDPLSLDIAPIVMCDDIVWSLFGLSMASYNMLASLVLFGLWVAAARKV